MKILINRYHPVCEDLAITFSKLGHDVTLSVKTDINDHYGSWKDILKELKGQKNFKVIDYKQALVVTPKKNFDLIGADGAFEGDRQLFELARKANIPTFAIAGYPHLMDEPSDNILSLGWSLPILQYLRDYPSEGHRKEVDWKNIAETGRSSGKNICVFYPNFWKLKEKALNLIEDNKCLPYRYFVSGIQRYEECNRFNYEVFNKIKYAFENNESTVINYEGMSHADFIKEIASSWGLLHLKHADQPGISVIEALILGKPIFTMRSFVLGSHNHDMLIHGENAWIADSVDELIEYMNRYEHCDAHLNYKIRKQQLETKKENHIDTLTSFDRQKEKLERFINRCVAKETTV